MNTLSTMGQIEKIYYIPLILKKAIQNKNDIQIKQLLKRIEFSKSKIFNSKVSILYYSLQWTLDIDIIHSALSYYKYDLIQHLQFNLDLYNKLDFDNGDDNFALSYYHNWLLQNK